MIKNAAILFLLLSVSSCATQNNIENVTEIEIIKNANAFMDSWHQAASDANFENYFGKMDTQSVFIGTDTSENWTKQQFEAYSKPHFDKGDAWDFKTLEETYISMSQKPSFGLMSCWIPGWEYAGGQVSLNLTALDLKLNTMSYR